MAATPELKRLEAEGTSFAYLERGDGPLVVLLHGFPDTPHGYAPAHSALADAGYRAVAPYLRGYTPGTAPQHRNVTVEMIGRDVLDLIAALDRESAVVIGHDWGAVAAYCLTASTPR